MPAEPTHRGTKHDVHETTTCCACSEHPEYVLPEAGSDDIQIPISNCTRQIWEYESCATQNGLSTWSCGSLRPAPMYICPRTPSCLEYTVTMSGHMQWAVAQLSTTKSMALAACLSRTKLFVAQTLPAVMRHSDCMYRATVHCKEYCMGEY